MIKKNILPFVMIAILTGTQCEKVSNIHIRLCRTDSTLRSNPFIYVYLTIPENNPDSLFVYLSNNRYATIYKEKDYPGFDNYLLNKMMFEELGISKLRNSMPIDTSISVIRDGFKNLKPWIIADGKRYYLSELSFESQYKECVFND